MTTQDGYKIDDEKYLKQCETYKKLMEKNYER